MTTKPYSALILYALAGLLAAGSPSLADSRPTGALQTQRRHHTATLLPDGRVLVAGGEDDKTLASCEIYDPKTGTWRPTGFLQTPRYGHTGTYLANGQVLVAGGFETVLGVDIPVSSIELYDPATETWTRTDCMNADRAFHTATRLQDGKVLFVGGTGGAAELATAEIYDPSTGTCTPDDPLQGGRQQHTATLLPDGRVLVTGGIFEGGFLDTVEVYEPGSGWSVLGSLLVARRIHTATLLPSGDVLVAGGDSGTVSTTELYDPNTETSQSAGDLGSPLGWHSATLMPSGKVVLIGGTDGTPVARIDVYDPDPAPGNWSSAGTLVTARSRHSATLLPSGQILVAGGFGGGFLSASEIFTQKEPAWDGSASDLGAARYRHTATPLPDGTVLVVGGLTGAGSLLLNSSERFDPVSGTWQATKNNLTTARYHHSATLLPDGTVLVVGGENAGALSSVEIYDPGTGLWTAGTGLPETHNRHSATPLLNGKVLVAGSKDDFSVYSSAAAAIYDPEFYFWQRAAPMNQGRHDHTATLLPDGNVLVVGGTAVYTLGSVEIYDVTLDQWQFAAALANPRKDHTATLLPSGRVLVAGGLASDNEPLETVEIYDPVLDTWTPAAAMNEKRYGHSATVLPDGSLLVAGGRNDTGYLASAECFDPATGTWTQLPATATAHYLATATLLASGDVLLTGGFSGTATTDVEIYRRPTPAPARKPVITDVTWPPGEPEEIIHGTPFFVTGIGFDGDFESSGSGTGNSTVNHPVFKLRPLGGEIPREIVPDALPTFRPDPPTDPQTFTFSRLPPLDPGPHLLSVVTAGLESDSWPLEVGCGLEIVEHPADQTVPVNQRATFRVDAPGGRTFRWFKDGFEIGLFGNSYTTPPLTAADSGATFHVEVDSGCVKAVSDTATLTIEDHTPPTADVLTPNGGEYWLLSKEPAPTETVAWTMSDDIRICRVDVTLLYSNDGGAMYYPAPPGGGLPATFGDGGACAHPGEQTTTTKYKLPADPPSGVDGSLYKIEVRVTDHAGNGKVVWSARPFYMVRPGGETIKTLILTYPDGMTGSTGEMMERLEDLAAHPLVQGRVVDLRDDTEFVALYNAWKNAGDADLANEALFAPGGVHDYLLTELYPAFPSVENLILVGGDDVIPMARVADRTDGYLESHYTSDDPAAGLYPDATTVGRALTANRFLSDDPLALRKAFDRTKLLGSPAHFLPDLKVGRLVETPQEVVAAVGTFISHDGVLDLAALTSNAFLVTSYDFLEDAGNNIRDRVSATLGAPETLIGQVWTGDNLKTELCAANGVACLNTHATHYEVGTPNGSPFHVHGVSTDELNDPDVCGPGQPLDLQGRVVYGVGCHSALPVPDVELGHPFDLAQTFLSRGVASYLGNTGYGWGLKHGIGLSERLVEIFTEEMTSTGSAAVGDLVQRAKTRYFLEAPRFDAYDVKTSMQWSLFGIPTYTIRTGLPASPLSSGKRAENPDRETIGGVVVERTTDPSDLVPPDFMTQLGLRFDLSGPNVYRKYDADGNEVIEPGCPHPDGCYYRLNDLSGSTGDPDLPIQPFLVYDSRLSGTSQHGVLWLGASYEEDPGWIPIFAQLISNGGDLSDHGTSPEEVERPPEEPLRKILAGEDECRESDDDLNSLVLTTGDLVQHGPASWTQRIFHQIDVEALYYNNTVDPLQNCDRSGPVLGEGPFHTVQGRTVSWDVPLSDSDVWRVIVLFNDVAAKRWTPVELQDDGTGNWTGSYRVTAPGTLTYFVQAADLHGNVEWAMYAPEELPASGLDPEILAPFKAEVVDGDADLAIDAAFAPEEILTNEPLVFTLTVENLGPATANDVMVTIPATLDVVNSWGTGWVCDAGTGPWTCIRDFLEVGSAPAITVLTYAGPTGGAYSHSFTAASVSADPVAGNNTETVDVLVIGASMSDLEIVKEDGGATPVAGEPFSWSITVTNRGPNPVPGATVTDVFPAEVHGVIWTCLASLGSSCTASGGGDLLDTVTLEPQGTLLYQVDAEVDMDAAGLPLVNTATVSMPPSFTDYNSDNDSFTVASGPIYPSQDTIFSDSFETGDTSTWSTAVGLETP